MDVIQDFVGLVSGVAGSSTAGLHEPVFGGNEKKYLAECIDSGYVSSVGSFVSAFEESVRDFVGAEFAIAVVNGTTALHLSLLAVGIHPGDEVIVPAMSFVATANAVSHAGAIPHFVDVDYAHWGIDPVKLRTHLVSLGQMRNGKLHNIETGRPIAAIVPMHALGHPVDIEPIRLVAEEFGLVIVEDAAESLGSYVHGLHTGVFGEVGVFSFNGNKTITTGGGGVIVTNDGALAKKLKHLSTTARVPHEYEFDHDTVGYNYRMPNLNAALGLAQMEQLPNLLASQRTLFELYSEAFFGSHTGVIRREPEGARSNYWLQAILLAEDLDASKNDLIDASMKAGISVRPLWKPLNSLSPYTSCPSALTPVSDDLYNRVICLPSSASLANR